ncbi:MAG: ankyrin repeat domain-containing protein [Bacteroidota bacterium]
MQLFVNKMLFVALLLLGGLGMAQENVFLDRSYWKANPTLEKVKSDIALGNDPAELNGNAFDAVTWALIEKTDNVVVKFLLELDGNGVNKLTHDGRTYIFWAAYKDNLLMMHYLLDKGARTDVIDSHGYSVMNFAAATGQKNPALYDFLIAQGADPKTEKNDDGANALLLLAPFLEDDTMIDYFADKGLDPRSTDTKGNGLFNYAAKKGNIDFLTLLINKGMPYKSVNKENGNAFIFASQGTRGSSNSLETYKYLEQLGIEPNITTDKGFTPLHALGYKNTDLKIFSYFIEKGVDVDQKDMNGNTAFINAASRNALESVSFLAKHVKDINLANNKGQSALTRAVSGNASEVVKMLLERGAQTSGMDSEGNSMGYYLINSYRNDKASVFAEKLSLLSKAGLQLDKTHAGGQTVWHLAVKKNNLNLLKQVAQWGASIDQKNDEGLTPLHLAAMKATDTDILKFLIQQGADKSIKTDFDETVMDIAKENELLKNHNTELSFLE